METGLANRVVLVTGASGGIGAGLVRGFRGEGALVGAHYGHNAAAARALCEEPGPRGVALGADLTEEAEVLRLFRETETALGPVEVLVANAGKWPSESVPLADLSLERWRWTLDTDLTSVFLCAREFLRGVRQHGLAAPALVLIGSTAGIFGEAGHADYAAAKAALTYGLARSLKNEICRLAPRGRVNVVCPGWTRTPMARGFHTDPNRVLRALQTVPLRKTARPFDVAAAVIYLASDRLAGHVNGQILTVAGGMEGRVLYRDDEIDLTKA